MEIREFNCKNKEELKKITVRNKNIDEFDRLQELVFTSGKVVFLVLKKSILKQYRILAYAIVDEDMRKVSFSHNINREYACYNNVVYISDFLVSIRERNKGLGTQFAKYIINERYNQRDIILQPQEDGLYFWKKFGFENDGISEHETWKLKNIK